MRRGAILGAIWLAGCGAPDEEAVGPTDSDGRYEAVEKIRSGELTDERPEVGTIGGCTATLVAQDVAITASHCVGYRSRNGPGNYYTLRLTNGGDTRNYTVDRYRSFSRDLGANDIALLGLADLVPLDFAQPAPLAQETPADGTSLTVFGFGCTRLGAGSDGRKRQATYEQGDTAYHLCPGDSGGPVFNDETGAVARINSGYRLDRGRSDIYGLVPGLYDDLYAQVLDWTQGEIPEEGDPLGGLDPNIEVCGRNTDVFEAWTCTAARGHRHRCLPGGSPVWEPCADGCVSRSLGEPDVCADAQAANTCGALYLPYVDWACATDDLTLLRCSDGQLELRACAGGCEPVEAGPDTCF